MPNSYVNLIYHLIFSTKERRPFIKGPFRGRLYDYFRGAVLRESMDDRSRSEAPTSMSIF
jgi:hypothetical protein